MKDSILEYTTFFCTQQNRCEQSRSHWVPLLYPRSTQCWLGSATALSQKATAVQPNMPELGRIQYLQPRVDTLWLPHHPLSSWLMPLSSGFMGASLHCCPSFIDFKSTTSSLLSIASLIAFFELVSFNSHSGAWIFPLELSLQEVCWMFCE